MRSTVSLKKKPTESAAPYNVNHLHEFTSLWVSNHDFICKMFKNNKMQTGQSAIYTTVQLLCEWQTYESGERQREGEGELLEGGWYSRG